MPPRHFGTAFGAPIYETGATSTIMSTENAEWTQAERQEVFAEALHHPETAEERAAQQTTFRAWLNDPCYEHLRPMLERMIDLAPVPAVNCTVLSRQSLFLRA
jgi:hypothetical protein